MRSFNQFLLLLASALLLLHSFVPHEHHADMTGTAHETEHRQADSLLDWLQLTFHADLAPNHLQEIPELPSAGWEYSAQQEIALPLVLPSEKPVVRFSISQQTAFLPSPAPLGTLGIALPPTLRAPPSLA